MFDFMEFDMWEETFLNSLEDFRKQDEISRVEGDERRWKIGAREIFES